MQNCIKKLLEYRKDAGVHPNNPYLFGLPQTKETTECKMVHRHLLANNLIRNYAKACGATNPRALRATQLRKHVATESISLNLNSREINNLQTFLGHADKVHREYYRQPIIVDDIVNMSKLLLNAQGDVSHKLSHSSRTVNVSQPSTSHSPSSDDVMLSGTSHTLSPIQEHNENQSNDTEHDSNYLPINSSSDDSEDSSKLLVKKKRLIDMNLGFVGRRTWRTPEKHTIQEIFKAHIEKCQIPTGSECLQALRNYPALKGRTIPQMQMWVRNHIRRIYCKENSYVKKTWSTPERHAVRETLRYYVEGKHRSYPSLEAIRKATVGCPHLQNKTPKHEKSNSTST